MSNLNPSSRLPQPVLFGLSLTLIASFALILYLVPNPIFPREPLTDNVTREIPFVEKGKIDASMKVIQYADGVTPRNIDSMIYNGGDYYKYPIVIDTDYYQTHAPTRGDVVFFNDKVGLGWAPEGKPDIKWGEIIGRIVGLPGETVELRNNQNQVYIDGVRLATFYGSEEGFNPEAESRELDKPRVKIPKFKVPEGHVYIMFDNWSRAGQLIGSTPQSEIIGKVLGYEQP